MKIKFLFILALCLIFLFGIHKKTYAIYDPLSVPNNKIGIHILFPSELQKAAELVNSSGGDWGYVIIPIQVGDKDIDKWQTFLDETRRHHLIPILRLATEGDYFNNSSWRKPKESDVLDFANFLSSLEWPVKNRYIVVFNEVNRADEWNGLANPGEYANLLLYASSVFKDKNPDFFIISSGLDNAAITSSGSYNEYDFLRIMHEENPEVFFQIDGLGSHAYPNPGFASPPNSKTNQSIISFLYEQELIKNLTGRLLPVFITETNWTQEKYSDKIIGNYFTQALNNTWNSDTIVAITPFLLQSGPGPFQHLSFLTADGNPNEIYNSYKNFPKKAGKPMLNPIRLFALLKNAVVPVKNFSTYKFSTQERLLKDALKWLFFGN